MVTPRQKATAQAIVNIFETGTVKGDYALCVVLAGDSGGLTYGRSQTTLNSGNLAILITEYCNADGATLAEKLRPYLARLTARDATLNDNSALKALLRSAGADPVMRETQDRFFDAVYWVPAVKAAESLGISTGLGMAVVYDSVVHGSLTRMARRTTDLVGSAAKAGEKNWIMSYLGVRRRWLVSANPPLPNTVYRQDEFRKLIAADNWSLNLPLLIRGICVSEETMGYREPITPITLWLGGKARGTCWLNDADGALYFPARQLLEELVGDRTDTALSWSTNKLTWEGAPLPVPAVLRDDGIVWASVRRLCAWLGRGYAVDYDAVAKTVTVSVKATGEKG